MWRVYKWIEKDIIDGEGCIIYPAKTWYLIGSYDTVDIATNIVKHEIYLYNCTAEDGEPNPKFKIESDLD